MARSVLLLLALPLSAAGQQPNQFAPPKTQPPDAPTLQKIKARTAELKTAIAALPKSSNVRDVEVYAKAAEWIVAQQEWFDPKAGEKTLAVLDAGLKRAAELKGLDEYGVPSWMGIRGRPVIRSYRSEVDGSVQPYAITIPAGGPVPKRLDVVLHGRDATLTEVKFIHARETAKPSEKAAGFVQVEVYGRGNNAYRWAGEADVREVMKDVMGMRAMLVTDQQLVWGVRFPVVLRGFSMGGAGTWHLGLHRPFLFTVLGPGAGFTTTRGYVKNLPARLPDYIERCLHIYDAADYAENAFNVPIVAYSGEKDPQKAAADNVFARLKDLPFPTDAVHLVAPGIEHKMPPEWVAKAEAEYAKRVATRTDWPERVRFVTYTLRYSGAKWASINALDRHYDKAVIDGHWAAKDLTITTANVRGMDLIKGPHPFPAVIAIDGQKVTVPVKEAKGPESLVLVKTDGKWGMVDWKTRFDRLRQRPEKEPGLQGPIDDAFMDPFLVVPPAGDSGYTVGAFRQFGHIWPRYFRGQLPTKPADRVTKDEIDRNSLVLFGDPVSNPLIAQVLPKLPIKWTKDELVVNGVKYDPKTHVPVLIYPNPLNPTRYVVLNSGHTFREADLRGTNASLYPRLGDWAVLRPAPTKDDPTAAEVVAAGLFDEFWQFPK